MSTLDHFSSIWHPSSLDGFQTIVEPIISASEQNFTPWYPLTSALIQHSFRSRNDDGNESAATWLAALNANIDLQKDANVRVRFLIDSSGNPDPTQFQLEYKKSTDSDWVKVT